MSQAATFSLVYSAAAVIAFVAFAVMWHRRGALSTGRWR